MGIASALPLVHGHPQLLQLLSRPRQGGADGVFGHADFGTDLSIGFAFQVELADDLGVGLGKVFQEEGHFFDGFGGGVWNRFASGLEGGSVSFDMAPSFGLAAADDFLHHDPAGDDGQVGRQRTLLAKTPQDREIVFDQPEKNLRAEIVDVVICDPDTAGVCGVTNHMYKQTHKSVNEVLPSPWRTHQTLLEKSSIDVRQRHDEKPHGDATVFVDLLGNSTPEPGIGQDRFQFEAQN